jgi:hypothetical protein
VIELLKAFDGLSVVVRHHLKWYNFNLSSSFYHHLMQQNQTLSAAQMAELEILKHLYLNY